MIPFAKIETLSSRLDFIRRHIGSAEEEVNAMLKSLGVGSLNALMDQTIPENIRMKRPLQLPPPRDELQALHELRGIAVRNQIFRSFIGMGYHECFTPPVIQRNILENPGWYTAYTPYQAEIAQGRLEALLNFQTMIRDLTAMDIANASLLDEGTAAAEAMSMARGASQAPDDAVFFVSEGCHPQTIDVVKRRAEPLNIKVLVGDIKSFKFDLPVFGVLLQYPDTYGVIHDLGSFIAQAHEHKALAVVAADLLSLVILKPPGEFGADIVVGSAQRFGVPMGFGGPHAAFMATRDAFKRTMPGRLIGVSKDAQGNPGMRLSLQTREQHIRRDKATSNICTAQVLLAVMASMYAVYHGPGGLRRIAQRIHVLAAVLKQSLDHFGFKTGQDPFFDTICVEVGERQQEILEAAKFLRMNLRIVNKTTLGISIGETTTPADLTDLLSAFTGEMVAPLTDEILTQAELSDPSSLTRASEFLTHPVFNSYHTETEMMRYIRRLEAKDLSLTTSMIPLGSCTMKLNASAEMIPVTWPEFGALHPFAPAEQTQGYRILFQQLESWLSEITGFAAVSLQPNAGSAGEYAGLLAIRDYHKSRGEANRTICLIPTSAHGTNPASAVMAGFKVIPVKCDDQGNVDLNELQAKATEHQANLGAMMVTYPSTHGVFEAGIREACAIVHEFGGQVYMDGANMNAQVGMCRPGDIGADVCHLNLHKTFCIPHGGGGPGVGPIGVARHLAPFLPGHSVVEMMGHASSGAVSSAPWGSASILPISWMYIAMLGTEGLTLATQMAILNANYIAKRLEPYFPIFYRGANGRVAHECIIDFSGWKAKAGIEVEDVAKRLMDYGFHAPTMSWPVPGTLMIEPTESESKAELDRFCDAMIAIHQEMQAVESGRWDKVNNPLKNAPHTAQVLISDTWDRPYSREVAAYPAPWTKTHKFWPTVGRIDNVYGDRNLVCSCLPVESYTP